MAGAEWFPSSQRNLWKELEGSILSWSSGVSTAQLKFVSEEETPKFSFEEDERE
jgi:hypothetical protein